MYNHAELAGAIRKLICADLSEADEDILIANMSASIQDPEWMNLIFQSGEFHEEKGVLDVEAVCDRILAYKPIAL